MKTTSKEEKDLQPISVERAIEIVEKYFKDVNVIKLEVRYPIFGKMVVDIIYEDFKPEKEVRRDLEDLLPLSNVNVFRDFSDKEARKAFNEAWYDGGFWNMVINGKRREVSLRTLIYDYLEDKTL